MSGTLFIAFIAIVIIACIVIYNKLVSLKNRFKNSYAQIDVQLNRRYDLIPNLVETAKTYMQHEKETLEAVISARNQAVDANQLAAGNPDNTNALKGIVGAESVLTGALGRLFALAENYPDLKANQTMEQLMEELSSTENKVAFARQAYNDSVMAYNTYREQFPSNLFANSFNFKEAELFEVEAEEAKNPVKVSFD